MKVPPTYKPAALRDDDEVRERESPDGHTGGGIIGIGGGTIGIVSQETSRFSSFSISMLGVVACLPPGSRVIWTQSVDIPGNCNTLCRSFTGEWLWIMGDDHVFRDDILLRLLAHDVDVIVPHCLKRVPPWASVVYSHQDAEGWYHMAELPPDGPVEIHAAGSAGMLIRRHVLEAIADPWFRPAPNAEGLNEDLYFCQQVREAGFKLWCDPSVLLGHTAVHTVWPAWREGRWNADLVHDQNTSIPIRRMTTAEADEAMRRPTPTLA